MLHQLCSRSVKRDQWTSFHNLGPTLPTMQQPLEAISQITILLLLYAASSGDTEGFVLHFRICMSTAQHLQLSFSGITL